MVGRFENSNKFGQGDTTLANSNENQEIEKSQNVYQKMLNNLLGITNRDNAILTKSRQGNFDLKKYLFAKDYERIFSQKNFHIELSATKIGEELKNLSEIKNVNDFLYEVDNMAITITMADRKKLLTNFVSYKPQFLAKVSKNNLKNVIAHWQKFQSKYIDIQFQTNVWPLYIATCFIRVVKDDVVINAPLFLKKVEIEIVNDKKVFINSLDERIELNEKLLFVLKNDFNLEIPELNAHIEDSFDNYMLSYRKILSQFIVNRPNLRGDFRFLNVKKLTPCNFTYVPGATLSIVSPAGGSLRQRFVNTISGNEKLNNLLQTYKKEIRKEIIQDMRQLKGVFRITETDASQEMAIMGSLKDHSIIWGPPGTGKSQTICNIIANLLEKQKMTIVTSEKQAALEVIKARMGKLAKFLFFGLVSKNMLQDDKKSFYQPFADLAEALNSKNIEQERKIKNPYVNKAQVVFSRQKHLLALENIDSLINIAKTLYQDKQVAKRILDLHHALKLSPEVISEYVKRGNLKQILLEKNLISKSFFPKYDYDVKKLIYATKVITNDEALYALTKIQDINNAFNLPTFLDNEMNFLDSQNTFENDVEYLEAILIKRFQKKVAFLKQDENWALKIDAFLKQAKAGFRIPYKFISMHKEVIQKIYDIFVSTPETLAAFTSDYQQYDYAIFDEASQIHLEKALPFVASARINIIAGDNQQMRPSNFFAVRDHDLDQIGTSLLDYAYSKNLKADGHEYMLKKNYRSEIGELMLFSSRQFYKSKLEVIDNCDKTHLSAIDVYNVYGKWEGRINEKEAEAVLDTALIESQNYQSLIILTFNTNQQQYMLKLIFTRKQYKSLIPLLNWGKLKLRNLENIQGDEAELIIVSVAYDKNTPLGSTYVTRPSGGNALNVAISRAQKRMIVFKSLFADDIKKVKSEPTQVFKNWLKYLELNKIERNNYLLESKSSSLKINPFAAKVYKYLKNVLYLDSSMTLEFNFAIGSYTMPIAVVAKNNGRFLLGIDLIDYNVGHGFVTMIKNLERRSFLAIKNYPILEITEIHWHVDPKKFIQKIQNEIDRLLNTWNFSNRTERRL